MQERAFIKRSSMLFKAATISGNFSKEPPMQFGRVVGNGLNAKYAFAFGIDLQSQVAAVQLEDGQIIRRFLDRDFPLARMRFAFVIFRPMPVSEDGLDGLEIKRHTAAVNQRLKHLLHLPTQVEHQVAAVLELEVRVLIMKSAPLLLLQLEGKAQTGGINPTLADLTQSPYSRSFRQGICDLRQACGVGDISKTVSFFGKANSCLSRLAGYVLVTVQHHLYGKRRMSADLDGNMTPVRVQNVNRVVVH